MVCEDDVQESSRELEADRQLRAQPDADVMTTVDDPAYKSFQLPLSSRRVTAAYLRAIAKAMKLPTAGSADQLRQCIEAQFLTANDVVVDPKARAGSSPHWGRRGIFAD